MEKVSCYARSDVDVDVVVECGCIENECRVFLYLRIVPSCSKIRSFSFLYPRFIIGDKLNRLNRR